MIFTRLKGAAVFACIAVILSTGSKADNVTPPSSSPTVVTDTGQTFAITEYCGRGADAQSHFLGRTPCGTNLRDAGSLKRYIAEVVRRDIGTINHMFYLGQEVGPAAVRASDVPVCDMARGGNVVCSTSVGSDTRTCDLVGTSGEGLALSTGDLKTCFQNNSGHEEKCFNRNNLQTYPKYSGTAGASTALDIQKTYCGTPCKFVEGTHNFNSDGTKDVFKVADGSCGLEYSWVRGLWPRLVWSSASAPKTQKLRIGPSDQNSFAGVLYEIEDGALHLTTLSSRGETKTCGTLAQDITDKYSQLKRMESELNRMRTSGGAASDPGGCRSLTSAQTSQATQTALSDDAQRTAGLTGTNTSRTSVQSTNSDIQRFSAAYCMLESAENQLYNAISKLALCEVLSRARGKFEFMIGNNPAALISDLANNIKDNCPQCSDRDEFVRRAAYYGKFKDWFVRTFIADPRGTPNMPVSDPTGAGSLEPPTQPMNSATVSVGGR